MPTRPLRPVHRFAALCAVLLVTACSIGSGTGDSAGHAGRSSSSGPTARSGTLNAAISAEPDQLDPQKATT